MMIAYFPQNMPISSVNKIKVGNTEIQLTYLKR